MDYYITSPGDQYPPRGPYTKAALIAMHRSGELSADTLYATEGMEQWERVDALVASQPPPLPSPNSADLVEQASKRPLVQETAIRVGRWLEERWRIVKPRLLLVWSYAAARSKKIRSLLFPDTSLLSKDERLIRLERQNVVFRWIGLSIAVCLVSSWGINGLRENHASSTAHPDTELVIKDAQGRVRYWLGLNDSGELAQRFLDQSGQERFSVNLLKSGVVNQRISDSRGTLRAVTYTTATAEAAQVFFDKSGHRRLCSMNSDDGGCFLTLYDQNEIGRCGMMTTPDSGIAEWFADRYGKNRIVTAVNPDGSIIIPIPEESEGAKLWRWGDHAVTAIGAIKLLNEWINNAK